MNEFKLLPWQQVVIEFVESYDDRTGGEYMQALSDYDRAKASRIQVAMPDGSGHTTLAAYLALHYSAVLIYTDIEHYKELAVNARAFHESDNLNAFTDLNNVEEFGDTSAISVFHIYHDLMVSSKSNWEHRGLGRLSMKFGKKTEDQKVIIVDNATVVSETHPEIIDWLYQISTGPVVLLG